MMLKSNESNKLKDYWFALLFSIILLILSSATIAETTGSINVTTQGNISPTTGLYGYTVDFCNSDSECFDYKCFLDFDGSAGGGKAGWCNQTTITSCYSAGTTINSGILPTPTGLSICVTNTTYRTCTNGNWSAATSCASGQTCSGNGTCSEPAAAVGGGGGAGGETGTNVTTTLKASVEVLQAIADFEIVQGETATKNATVKNNGDLVLGSVLLELTGITWYSTDPTSFTRLNKTDNATFKVVFAPPNDTEVKSYSVQATVKTNYTDATASFTFNIKVLPSNETIQKQVIPTYEEYVLLIGEYEKNITVLEREGYNVTEAKSVLNTLKAKIQEVNLSLAGNDYFSASTKLTEMKSLFEELNNNLAKLTKEEQKGDLTIFIIIAIIIVVAVIAYLFWPAKEKPWQRTTK